MNKTKLFFLAYLLFSLVLIGGLSIWAIFQKVEAEMQKELAIRAKEEAIKQRKYALNAAMDAEKSKEKEKKTEIKYLIALDELEKQKALFEACKKGR